MENKICYELSYPISKISKEIIVKWCSVGRECFTPKRMCGTSITNGKTKAFKEKAFYDGLDKEMAGPMALRLSDGEGNYIWVTKGAYFHAVILSATIGETQLTGDFDKLMDELMVCGGIVGRKVASEDEFWQNSEDLSYYQEKKKSLDGIKTKISTIGFKREIVDIEGNPGHTHWVNGLWFGACHQMWFGRDYYKYVSKERLNHYTRAFEHTELDNEVIRITLYKDIWAYDEADNRALQWDFRKTAGIDEASGAVEDGSLSVEIMNGEFPHGGTKEASLTPAEEGQRYST